MTNPTPAQNRATGALLIASSALSVFAMLHHPTTHGHGLAALNSLADRGGFAALMHGSLLALMLAQLIGQAGLATRLGWGRLVVQGAVIAQAAGALALAGAAVINGFALSTLARRLLAAGMTDPAQYLPSLWALSAQSAAWAQLGTGAWAIALALWGLAVWQQQRWLALAALPLLLVPLAGGLGLLPLDVIGFGAVVVAQALWSAAAGLLLWRGRV